MRGTRIWWAPGNYVTIEGADFMKMPPKTDRQISLPGDVLYKDVCTLFYGLRWNELSDRHATAHSCTPIYYERMEISTIIILITLQTTYKTVYKTILKTAWKRLKPLVSFAFSKAGYYMKALWERMLAKSQMPIAVHEEKA